MVKFSAHDHCMHNFTSVKYKTAVMHSTTDLYFLWLATRPTGGCLLWGSKSIASLSCRTFSSQLWHVRSKCCLCLIISRYTWAVQMFWQFYILTKSFGMMIYAFLLLGGIQNGALIELKFSSFIVWNSKGGKIQGLPCPVSLSQSIKTPG